MAHLALSPVSVAVLAALNVAGLQALVGTRIYDDIPQGVTFPFVFYEVRERDVRGFGTGGLPEVELRVHAFSQYDGMSEAQGINKKVVELLRDQSLSVAGYAQAGLVFYDDSIPIPDSEVNGVKCKELVSMFRVYVEEAA